MTYKLRVFISKTTCFKTPTQSYYEYYLLPTDGVDFSLISFLSVKKKITSLKASVCKEKAMRKLDKFSDKIAEDDSVNIFGLMPIEVKPFSHG